MGENSGWVLILTLKGTVFSTDREMPRDRLHLFIFTNSRGETRTHRYQIIVMFFKSSFMSFQRTNTAASNLWVYSVTQDLSNSEGGNVHWLQGQIKMKYICFKIKQQQRLETVAIGYQTGHWPCLHPMQVQSLALHRVPWVNQIIPELRARRKL